MKVVLIGVPSDPGLCGVIDSLESAGWIVHVNHYSDRGLRPFVVIWEDNGEKHWPGRRTINPITAVKRSCNRQESLLLLSYHGIPVDGDQLPPGAVKRVRKLPLEEYRVVTVDVADLDAFHIDHWPWRHSPRHRRMFERIMETAARSVYLLGLHFGRVRIMAHAKREWFVSAVEPTPAVDEDKGRQYGRRIARLLSLYEDSGLQKEVTLGADPEFALYARNGGLVDVSNYVDQQGMIGYDRTRYRRRTSYPTAEIRPKPSPSPLALAARVERALHQAHRLLPVKKTQWIAGSFPLGLVPTGGHIHFSDLPLTTPVLEVLDRYLAVPLMLLERRVPAKRRRRRYGRLGDFRIKDHGGFEYRTPASWLVSREATRAALTLAKVVTTDWMALTENFSWGPHFTREFYLSRKARFRRMFPTVWRRIMELPSGRQYEYELGFIRDMVRAGREWNEEQDIKTAW